MSKTVEALRTANEIPLAEKEEPDYISFDAPPLDFSFKNIKHISGSPFLTQNSKTFSRVRERRKSPKRNRRPNPVRKRKRKNMRKPRKDRLVGIRKRTKSSSYSLRIT